MSGGDDTPLALRLQRRLLDSPPAKRAAPAKAPAPPAKRSAPGGARGGSSAPAAAPAAAAGPAVDMLKDKDLDAALRRVDLGGLQDKVQQMVEEKGWLRDVVRQAQLACQHVPALKAGGARGAAGLKLETAKDILRLKENWKRLVQIRMGVEVKGRNGPGMQRQFTELSDAEVHVVWCAIHRAPGLISALEKEALRSMKVVGRPDDDSDEEDVPFDVEDDDLEEWMELLVWHAFHTPCVCPRWAKEGAPALTLADASCFNNHLLQSVSMQAKLMALCADPRMGKSFAELVLQFRDMFAHPGRGVLALINTNKNETYDEYVEDYSSRLAALNECAQDLNAPSLLYTYEDLKSMLSPKPSTRALELRNAIQGGSPYILVLEAALDHLKKAQEAMLFNRSYPERAPITWFDECQSWFMGCDVTGEELVRNKKQAEQVLRQMWREVGMANIKLRVVSATLLDWPEALLSLGLDPKEQTVLQYDKEKAKARNYFNVRDGTVLHTQLEVMPRSRVARSRKEARVEDGEDASGPDTGVPPPLVEFSCKLRAVHRPSNMYGMRMDEPGSNEDVLRTTGWEHYHPALRAFYQCFLAEEKATMLEAAPPDVNTKASMENRELINTRLAGGRLVSVLHNGGGVKAISWCPDEQTHKLWYHETSSKSMSVPDVICYIMASGHRGPIKVVSNLVFAGAVDYNLYPRTVGAELSNRGGKYLKAYFDFKGVQGLERDIKYGELLHRWELPVKGRAGGTGKVTAPTSLVTVFLAAVLQQPNSKPTAPMVLEVYAGAALPPELQAAVKEGAILTQEQLRQLCRLVGEDEQLGRCCPLSAPIGTKMRVAAKWHSPMRLINFMSMLTTTTVDLQKALQALGRIATMGAPPDHKVLVAAIKEVYDALMTMEPAVAEMLAKQGDHLKDGERYQAFPTYGGHYGHQAMNLPRKVRQAATFVPVRSVVGESSATARRRAAAPQEPLVVDDRAPVEYNDMDVDDDELARMEAERMAAAGAGAAGADAAEDDSDGDGREGDDRARAEAEEKQQRDDEILRLLALLGNKVDRTTATLVAVGLLAQEGWRKGLVTRDDVLVRAEEVDGECDAHTPVEDVVFKLAGVINGAYYNYFTQLLPGKGWVKVEEVKRGRRLFKAVRLTQKGRPVLQARLQALGIGAAEVAAPAAESGGGRPAQPRKRRTVDEIMRELNMPGLDAYDVVLLVVGLLDGTTIKALHQAAADMEQQRGRSARAALIYAASQLQWSRNRMFTDELCDIRKLLERSTERPIVFKPNRAGWARVAELKQHVARLLL